MRIMAFLGSPRKGGNTSILLDEAMRGVQEGGHAVELFRLAQMNIHGCLNCGGCEETGACVIEGDEMPKIYAAIREADRIILASPIFFSGIPAQAKAMIDRCQALWCEKYLLKREIPAGPAGRKGLFLTVGGMKMVKHAECANSTVTAFFRTVSVPEHAFLPFRGVDAKGAIREHPTALQEAYEAGKALAAT
ncbi:MAG TPA: flavodoxin family protein [bacterium]